MTDGAVLEVEMPTMADVSPFSEVLGADYDKLPAIVRRMHDPESAGSWRGRARVSRGRSLIARAMAQAFGLPSEGEEVAISITVSHLDGVERLERNYGGRIFATDFAVSPRARPKMIEERIGLTRFQMGLSVADGALRYDLLEASWLGVPATWLYDTGDVASERSDGRRYLFEVEVGLARLGRLVAYSGWLEPDVKEGA